MIGVDAHRERILSAARPLPAESVSLSDALGRALAVSVATRWPVPLFDNSAMDGYAVRAQDAVVGATLTVVADIPAGSDADPLLGPGEAARIMTGAPVPTDADAIVPLEATDLGAQVRRRAPERVTVLAAPGLGAHVRRRGGDAPEGTEVVAAGAALDARALSTIASAGYDRVEARRPARVAILSTGSELIAPSGTPRRGQIPESNSVLLAAAVREAGARVVSVATVPDDPDALRAALAATDADVLILSGGASVGAFDVVKAVLSADGIRFDSVAMQPGKPQGFGTRPDGALVFCLPGNPVSVAVSFEMFVRPALRRLAGFSVLDRRRLMLPARQSWTTPIRRTQVLPVVIDGNGVRPSAAGGSGSHLVASLARAEAFAVIPADVERVEEGDHVTVMMLS